MLGRLRSRGPRTRFIGIGKALGPLDQPDCYRVGTAPVLEHAVEDEGDGLQTAVRVPLEPGRGEPVFAKHQESAFLTPLVVLLIDLLAPAGWRLAEDGLIDTLIGGAIVLPIGFAPWPMSWYAHLPQRFAEAARGVSAYLLEALQTSAAPDRAGGADCDQ
jgi:hypothetical protein